MNIQLSDHFTYRRLIRFTISTVLMLICTSMYSIVDGLFVSNYVGKMPFAATNLIWPVSMGIAAIGFMLGTGGSAIVAKTLGEGKKEKANQYFSMILYFGIIVSVIFSVICFIFTPQIARMLKADGELLEHCIVYGRILFATQTAFILQNMFQSFLVAAEEPVLSLKINIAAGLTNVVFDYLFIAVFEWGVAGAAIATGMGQIEEGVRVGGTLAQPGDAIIVTGDVGRHGCTILLAREDFGIEADVTSDCAPLWNTVEAVMNTTHNLHVIRDATRGGVGTVLYEIAGQSNVGIRLDAAAVPVAPEVKGVCGMLGLEPLYLACEGRMVIMAPKSEAEKIVETLRQCPYSKDAAIIGEVTADQPGKVVMTTEIGTQALLPQPGGELLPRIC